MVKLLDYIYITFIGFERLRFRIGFWDNPLSLHIIFINMRIESRTLAEFEVEFFFIIVNSFQPLAFVIRNSILDQAGFLGPPHFNIIKLKVRFQLAVFVQITLLTYCIDCLLRINLLKPL